MTEKKNDKKSDPKASKTSKVPQVKDLEPKKDPKGGRRDYPHR